MLRIHFTVGLFKCKSEVAGVTFSDSDSAPIPKFLNPVPDPGPAILQIWESDSYSDSGYNHWSNRILHMFLLKKWPHRLLLLLKWKSYFGSGFGFSQIFDSGSQIFDSGPFPPVFPRCYEEKPQNLFWKKK